MVTHPRFLGLDEGPFTFDDESAVVAGVLTRGAATVEAILIDRVNVDGWDATELVVRLVDRLPGTGPGRVLIDGVTLGGMNLVDLDQVAKQTNVPVLGIARREPVLGGLAAAAERAEEPERRRRMLPATPPIAISIKQTRLWVQAHDPTTGPLSDPAQIAELLRPAMAQGNTPEPLRLAHHIATAMVRGVSGTQP